jgi:O-antigen/teichoic acid export membrane protein
VNESKISCETKGDILEIHSALLAKNAFFNLLGLIVPLFGAVLTVPAIVRFLGAERYGVFSLALVVFGYFTVFDLGLGRSATKFIAAALGRGETESVSRYLWTCLAFQTIIGAMGGLLLGLMASYLVRAVLNIPPVLQAEAAASLRWLAVSLPFVLAYPSFRGLLEARQRFDLVNLVKIPTNTLIYVLPLAGVLMGSGLPGIVAILGLSRMATTLVWWIVCLKACPQYLRFGLLPRADLRPVLTFGGWNMLSAVVWTFLMSLDRFMIGALRTVEEVGYYSAPSEIVARLGVISGSLALTLFPAFSALNGRGGEEEASRLHARSLKFTILVLGPLVAVCLAYAHFILRIWLGSAFASEGEVVFQILAVGQLVNSLTVIPYSFIQGAGRADLTTKFQILESILFLPLLWFALRQAGIAGAAIAWTLRAGLDLFLLLVAARNLGADFLKKRRGQSLANASLASAVLTAVLWISRRLPGTVVWAAGAVVLYGYLTWFLVLDGGERRGVAKFLAPLGIGRLLERIPNVFGRNRDSHA